MKKRNGFTLIELLVVIAIIALLLAILMPALSKVKQQAKLVVCKSQQHQIVLAVTTYAVGYDDKLPPSIARRTNGSYNALTTVNYHPGQPAYTKNAMHIYLGDTLPDVDVFSCPLAGGWHREKEDYQYAYEHHDTDDSLHGSYNLYWNFKLNGINFEGPRTLASKSKLLISDVLLWHSFHECWWLSHPTKQSTGAKTNFAGGLTGVLWWDESLKIDEVPKRIRMNAGYTDGHVESFFSEETIKFNNTLFVPSYWR